MNSQTFHSSEKSRKEVAAGIIVAQVKDKHLGENCAFLTTSKRYFFFNQRPNEIICIHRTKGGQETVNVDFDVSLFASNPKNDILAVSSKKGDIAVIEVVEATDGTPCFSIKGQSLSGMEITAIALSEKQHLAVLLGDGSILLFESGDVKGSPIEIRGATPTTANKFISIHSSSLVVTQRDGIDIINLNTKKSHLTSSFVPHQQGTRSASVFARWNGGKANEILLVTLSSDSSEVRLWGMKDHGSIELKQIISLEGENPLPTRHMFVYENESKVLLMSYGSCSVIVLCADDAAQQFRRITDWSLGKEVLVGASFYTRKMREGKGVVPKMTVVIRDSSGITYMSMPEDDIEGPDNIGKNAGSLSMIVGTDYTPVGTLSGTGVLSSDASRHFGNHTSSLSPLTNNSVLTITSNTKNFKGMGASETNGTEKISDIIIEQGQEFIACLDIINKDITELKILADNNARTFQTQKAKENARMEGVKSATTNAHTLLNIGSIGAPGLVDPVALSSSNAKGALRTFYDSLPAIVEKAAFTTCKKDLNTKMVDAMKRVSCDAVISSSLDKVNLNITCPEPHLILKALNNQQKTRKDIILKHGNDANNVNDAVVMQSELSSRAVIKRSADFLKAIQDEIMELDRDVHDTISSICASHANAVAVASTPGAFVEEAKAMVAAGQYSKAVEIVTSQDDSTYLVEFLQSEVVEANRKTIIMADTLSIPVFVTFCTVLAKDIKESPGQISIRLGWLSDMSLSRSEQLSMLKEGGSELYPIVSGKLRQISGWLSEVNAKEVDMKTRRLLKQMTMILGKA